MTIHKPDIEIVNLEDLDFEVACEASPGFRDHEDARTATWAYWWRRPCGCTPFQYLCEWCHDKIQQRPRNTLLFCGRCGEGEWTMQEVLVRRERIK